MFSLERLLIAFSAFLGDSISKTPKVHVLVCLCAFGLLAVGMVLVEIEHDVFKLWVRFRSRSHLVSNEIFFSSRWWWWCFSLLFLSIVGKKTRATETKTRAHETEERVHSTRSLVLSFSHSKRRRKRESISPPFFPHLSVLWRKLFLIFSDFFFQIEENTDDILPFSLFLSPVRARVCV